MWPNASAATSDRRNPQPISTARMARSRRPLFVVESGAFSSSCACGTDSQFPKRTPFDLTPLIRVMPAASSGASSPLSAASTASFRTAVIRTLIEIGPRPLGAKSSRSSKPRLKMLLSSRSTVRSCGSELTLQTAIDYCAPAGFIFGSQTSSCPLGAGKPILTGWALG